MRCNVPSAHCSWHWLDCTPPEPDCILPTPHCICTSSSRNWQTTVGNLPTIITHSPDDRCSSPIAQRNRPEAHCILSGARCSPPGPRCTSTDTYRSPPVFTSQATDGFAQRHSWIPRTRAPRCTRLISARTPLSLCLPRKTFAGSALPIRRLRPASCMTREIALRIRPHSAPSAPGVRCLKNGSQPDQEISGTL